MKEYFPVIAYYRDGTPIHQGEDEGGHEWGGICNCVLCLEGNTLEKPKEKKKSSQQKLHERYQAGDPEVGLLGEPSGKFDYYVLYPKTKPLSSDTTMPEPSWTDYLEPNPPSPYL